MTGLRRRIEAVFYCQITEDDIDLLIRHNLIVTKRLKTRGRKLEIERREPNMAYDKLDNLVFCCYWCNNAKTDEFTEVEFRPIGEAMRKIWKERLQRARELEERFRQRFGGTDGIVVTKG